MRHIHSHAGLPRGHRLAGYRWRGKGQTGPGAPWDREDSVTEMGQEQLDDALSCPQTSFTKQHSMVELPVMSHGKCRAVSPSAVHWHTSSILTVPKGCDHLPYLHPWPPGGQGISHIGIIRSITAEGSGDRETWNHTRCLWNGGDF